MATDDASKPAEKDIRWVERQASFVGIAAMFPRPVFEPMVRKYWKEVANNQDNLGQKLAGDHQQDMLFIWDVSTAVKVIDGR